MKYYLRSIFSVFAVDIIVLFMVFSSAHAAPATDTVAYWKFDEGSGITASDSSGNNNTGTAEGDPVWVDGILGKALSFNGLSQFVLVPDNNIAEAVQEFSVSFWIKPSEASSTPARGLIGFIADSEKSAFNFGITQLYDGGKLYFRVTNISNNTETATANVGMGDAGWKHIVGVYDGAKIYLYLNGILQTNQPPFVGFTKNAAKPLRFDYDYKTGLASFAGAIDEVRVYHRALAAAEVTQLFNAPTVAVPPAPAQTPPPVPAPAPVPVPPLDQIMCTADVKLCSDGSFVSRGGPLCEFAACSIPAAGVSKLTLTRNLTVGARGEDVRSLQKFLNSHGFAIAASGVGSPGSESDYFGALTSAAIKKLQCQYGIVCAGSPASTGWGYVGPKTRAKISQL